ncbi:hypothetical protein ACLOJK_012071 [Asimina triloba]
MVFKSHIRVSLLVPGGENQTYSGRVIFVKCGDYTRRIGIDGTAEAIKDAIKSAFGLRTKRAFWLEDEDEVVRCLDRDMPIGTYSLHLDEELPMPLQHSTNFMKFMIGMHPLHLDEGLTIKVCHYDESDRIPVRSEEKTLYTEDDFREFLSHRGWAGLRELSGFRSVDTLDDLRPGAIYQGVRLLGD